ncbi:MAG: IS1595 family transposase [Rhodanobacteraceae bacterium]
MSLPEFLSAYGTVAACEKVLQCGRWSAGFVCPRCAGTHARRFARAHRKYWHCRNCRHQTSLLAGTLFASTKLPLTTWLLALYLLTQTKNGMAALELSRHLGGRYRTAWRVKHKLMQAMASRDAQQRLGGIVQIDDAYLGGEYPGGKAGRGSPNKRPIVVAVATNLEGHPGLSIAEPVAAFSTVALDDWFARRLTEDAEVYSDGLGAFRACIERHHAHSVIKGGGGKAGTEVPGARWVNVIMGNLKRSSDGTLHAFKFFRYTHRYLADATWLFNRRFNLKALVPRLLVAAARCQPWPEPALRSCQTWAPC